MRYEVLMEFESGNGICVSVLKTDDLGEANAVAKERQERRRRNRVFVVDYEAQ